MLNNVLAVAWVLVKCYNAEAFVEDFQPKYIIAMKRSVDKFERLVPNILLDFSNK